MTTTQPRNPIAFSGTGSAVDNYMSDAPVETTKVENWAKFNKVKPDAKKRTVLFSLMYQAQWTMKSQANNEVPDLYRLSNFLKSEKSPVRKPLMDMQPEEMEKLIAAFKGIIKHKWK